MRKGDGAWLNYLNMGLMLGSFAIALYTPFVLFLFAYAILGPLHYMTEISWLHERNYFARRRYDSWVLTLLALVWSGLAIVPFNPVRRFEGLSTLVLFSFGCGMVFLTIENGLRRLIALAGISVVALAATKFSALAALYLMYFLPTLVHVYLFTALFMFYGALKARSPSGYLSVAVLLLLPLLYLVLDPKKPMPTMYVVQSYWETFGNLNKFVFGVAEPRTQADMNAGLLRVFQSDEGLMFMRFVAFAYVYHYLNWFSKTSIIKWHQVPKRRLVALTVGWLACVALYVYNYTLGFQVVSILSLVHVFLEFPLNGLSIGGSVKELRYALRPATTMSRS